MCNSLNLCAIFWKSDLVNGTSAYECEIARNAAPEAQECGCSGTSLRRCWLGAAPCWTLLLRLGINIWHVIIAFATLGAISRVTIVSASNQNRACVGNECA
jgi:hypothetical protein